MPVRRQRYLTFLPDAPMSDDTEFVFIENMAFVNARKHEEVVARHVAEVEQLRKALEEAISWSYGEDVTPERRSEVERLLDA